MSTFRGDTTVRENKTYVINLLLSRAAKYAAKKKKNLKTMYSVSSTIVKYYQISISLVSTFSFRDKQTQIEIVSLRE